MAAADSHGFEEYTDPPGPDHRAPTVRHWPAVIPPAVRTWLYGVVLALIPLATAYGIVRDEDAPLWVALAGAVLSTGTALAYRPTRIGGGGGTDK